MFIEFLERSLIAFPIVGMVVALIVAMEAKSVIATERKWSGMGAICLDLFLGWLWATSVLTVGIAGFMTFMHFWVDFASSWFA